MDYLKNKLQLSDKRSRSPENRPFKATTRSYFNVNTRYYKTDCYNSPKGSPMKKNEDCDSMDNLNSVYKEAVTETLEELIKLKP